MIIVLLYLFFVEQSGIANDTLSFGNQKQRGRHPPALAWVKLIET